MTHEKTENNSDSNRKRNRSPVRSSLTKLEHVREELASLYRAARNEKLPVADAGRLAYILQILAKTIESSDLEKRVEALESAAEKESL
jgi:hypothetical protein